MKKLYLIVSCLLIIAITGCTKKTDVKSEAEALRKADLEWSNTAGAKDADGFVAAMAENGSILPSNTTIHTGRKAIRQWFSDISAIPGFAVSWKPTRAEVSESGELGYTVGTYEFQIKDKTGNTIKDVGKYMRIWKKDQDGTWKIAFAIANTDLPLPTPNPTPMATEAPIPSAVERVAPAPEETTAPMETTEPEETEAPMEEEQGGY